MNKVQIEFSGKVLKRGAVEMYKKKDALEFVKACQREKIPILGVDGFYITPHSTEPSTIIFINTM